MQKHWNLTELLFIPNCIKLLTAIVQGAAGLLKPGPLEIYKQMNRDRKLKDQGRDQTKKRWQPVGGELG